MAAASFVPLGRFDDAVVTVAGTHGKSTTTSMITVLLRAAGLDPSFAVGANIPALGVNAAHGTSGIFVAEADESDGSFLNYRPRIAVVTNVEPDHLDYYGTAEAVYESFDRFTASGGDTSTLVPTKRSRASASAGRSNDDCGMTMSTFSRRTTSKTASTKAASPPGGTT